MPLPLECPDPSTDASLCVLSSSSRGNSTALALGSGPSRRVILIDAGLSPRRTHRLLKDVGLGDVPIHAIILTHLDHDHWNDGWLKRMPQGARLFIHRRHRGRAQRAGLLSVPTEVFEHEFQVWPGLCIVPLLVSHDSLGTAAFRLDFTHTRRSIGFATDLGRATQALIDHFRGVSVLAIESNYCPELQNASGRPIFLKRRIMGGAGHLSNEESAEAIRAIAPTEHVVLLHLSVECNTPEIAIRRHLTCPCPVTVASDRHPTAWIKVNWAGAPTSDRPSSAVSMPTRAAPTPTLWDALV